MGNRVKALASVGAQLYYSSEGDTRKNEKESISFFDAVEYIYAQKKYFLLEMAIKNWSI